MFATKNTVIVPEIHGAQDATGVNLGQVPNLELESGTTGAPGHIVQQDGEKFDLQFGRMTLGSSTTFPAGHVIQTTTPTIYTGASSSSAGITQLGSHAIYYHEPSSMTNTITKIQGTSSFLLVHFLWVGKIHSSSGVGLHSYIVFADADTKIGVGHDFNRDATGTESKAISGGVPFVNLSAGSYTFRMALCRATNSSANYIRNGRSQTDQIDESFQSSWIYIQEIAG